MIRHKVDVPVEPTPTAPTDGLKTHPSGPSASENCVRIKSLGFIASKQIKMYGEYFELVSDPFVEGDYAVVNAVSRTDPTIRTLRLPVSILLGLANRSKKPVNVAGLETEVSPKSTRAPGAPTPPK
jgi:hypothetical protein